jgi:hypothetical protein
MMGDRQSMGEECAGDERGIEGMHEYCRDDEGIMTATSGPDKKKNKKRIWIMPFR